MNILKTRISLIIADLLRCTNDITKFTDIYNLNEADFDEDDKHTLLAAIRSKYIRDKDITNVQYIFELIYHDNLKATYETKCLIQSQNTKATVENFEEILNYAVSDDEKIATLTFILSKLLVSFDYDEEKIIAVTKQIKDITGDKQ